MNRTIRLIAIFSIILLSSCEKFLDEVPDKRLVVPSSLHDLRALLDDYPNMMATLGVGEISSDDYYISEGDWLGLSNEIYRRQYVWEKDYLFMLASNPWLSSYRKIYWSNIVLDNLPDIERNDNNKDEWDDLKGHALFIRGQTLLDIAIVWAPSYDGERAHEQLGIPLRLDSDFNKLSTRSTLKETYDQIVLDLTEAADLLRTSVVHPVRPNKAAAYGYLSRALLYMGRFDDCKLYSEKSLALQSELIDYNSLNPSDSYPIREFNKEVLFATYLNAPQPLSISRAKIDSNLYDSYDDNDLRRTIFFRNNDDGSVGFKGSYFGNIALFSGFSVNELYLQLAECSVRKGEIESGISYLTTLLEKRWRSENGLSLFVPPSLNSSNEALNYVLMERRKELLMRGLRWPEIKRLNVEGKNINLVRQLGDEIFELPANDLRFALPIPEEVVERTGMQQNPR